MSTDPKYLGPGYWAAWHLKSIHADTSKKKAEIARNIALDIANFPCLKCKNHAKEYVSRHPLMDAVRDNNKFSMFLEKIIYPKGGYFLNKKYSFLEIRDPFIPRITGLTNFIIYLISSQNFGCFCFFLKYSELSIKVLKFLLVSIFFNFAVYCSSFNLCFS